MALSMGRTARTIVWSSLAHLPEPERRVQFFLRLYGSDFPPRQRDEIAAHVRDATPAAGGTPPPAGEAHTLTR